MASPRASERDGFRPSKAMGQNFLVDPNVRDKIIRLSGIDKTCGVLEVGPGFGALTDKLIETAGYVVSVELDRHLASALREKLGEALNFSLIEGDILKTDLRSLISDSMRGLRACVCANLPYNITTPVISHLIEAGVFESITVMVQKEVAARMCAAPASSDYGAFSVYIRYHTQPSVLFDIPPECFSPRPKVTSSVVKLDVRKERLLCEDDEKRFFCIVKAAFSQRRKTLVNALFAAFGSTHGKDAITKAVLAGGFDANIRGEVLGVEDFIKISNRLK